MGLGGEVERRDWLSKGVCLLRVVGWWVCRELERVFDDETGKGRG